MQNIYITQNSFTTGVISPEVAERTDLDKYKSSLLVAKNMTISPYGSCSRRGGSQYIGNVKNDDVDAIITPFVDTAEKSYLLEVGKQYIRVWNDDQLETEIETPFLEPRKLNFTQSGDILYICSGDYPVKELRHTNTWTLVDMDITEPYFEYNEQLSVTSVDKLTTQGEEIEYKNAGNYTFVPTETGKYLVTVIGAGGGLDGTCCKYASSSFSTPKQPISDGQIKKKEVTLIAGKSYKVVVGERGKFGVGVSENKNYSVSSRIKGKGGGESSFRISEKEEITATGGSEYNAYPVYRYTLEKIQNLTILKQEDIEWIYNKKVPMYHLKDTYGMSGKYKLVGSDGYVLYSPSGGYVSIKQIKESKSIDGTEDKLIIGDTIKNETPIFNKKLCGALMKITQTVPSKSIKQSYGTEPQDSILTSSLYVGEKWKLIIGGLHKSDLTLERSYDKVHWEEYRRYISNEDQNFVESGSEKEPCYLRVVGSKQASSENAKNGNLTIVLTAMSYVNEGEIKITEVLSDKEVKYQIKKKIFKGIDSDLYAFSSWNDLYGYPKVACFFQDRLVFANTKKNPYSLWFSRTGDYYNFSTERADGTLTEDSAIKIDLVVRNLYEIRHLLPSNDLVVLTSGNEWIISGDTPITPSKCTPRVQTMRGSSLCQPWHIGNRIIYVQRDGGTIRDLGYQYESDNYNGDELNLFASHLTKNRQMVSSTYCQNPYSTLYFVRDDGEIVCLVYIKEQNVCAWSEWQTAGYGKYKDICTITNNGIDYIYLLVQRMDGENTKMYIEKINPLLSNDENVYLDCWEKFIVNSEPNGTTKLTLKANKNNEVVAIGRDETNGFIRKTEVVFKGFPNYDGTIETEQRQEGQDTLIVGIPYTSTIAFPNLELASQELALRGKPYKVTQVFLSLYQSYGGKIGFMHNRKYQDTIKYEFYTNDEYHRHGEHIMSWDIYQQLPTGDTGINSKNKILIVTDDPYPFTVKSITKEIVIGSGMVRTYNGRGLTWGGD